jgi:hypothetical protein
MESWLSDLLNNFLYPSLVVVIGAVATAKIIPKYQDKKKEATRRT